MPGPRPEGTVIWIRCSSPDQLDAVASLERKLKAQGDPIFVVTTLRDLTRRHAHRALPEPVGRGEAKEFLDYWKPTMSIWVGGHLDTRLIVELAEARVHNIMVDATADGLENIVGRWVPGALRSLLSQFEAILALDETAAERLARAGAMRDVIIVTGAMEDCAPVLPYNEAERAEVAGIVGTRPVWLAADARLAEAEFIAAAHKAANRRAHRLMAIVVPKDVDDVPELARDLRKSGLTVALRSQVARPADSVQVYLVDTEEELGLWYRISPITYLGGTLSEGKAVDPFGATTLGSAVIFGPQVAPYQKHANRLIAAGGCVLLRKPEDLGGAIDTLLAADKAAKQAHIAWDVASQGANVTNRIATYIQLRLEELAE